MNDSTLARVQQLPTRQTANPEETSSCRELVHRFYSAIDSGKATQGMEVVGDDAVFSLHGKIHNRNEIQEFLAARESKKERHTAHVITNDSAYRAENGDIVLVGTLLLYTRGDAGYQVQGIYQTEHVSRQTPLGWRLVGREAAPLHPPGAS